MTSLLYLHDADPDVAEDDNHEDDVKELGLPEVGVRNGEGQETDKGDQQHR